MPNELKVIEDSGMIKVYENEKGEKVVSARELWERLESKTAFTDWIKYRIEKYGFVEEQDFILNFGESTGGRPSMDYILKLDTAKELGMVEGNEKGRQIRQYFIECEKRYKHITEQMDELDMLGVVIAQIKENRKTAALAQATADKAITKVEALEHKLDIKVGKNYVKANNIATLLGLFSESNKPHAQLIGAVAKCLGMKIGFRNYFEDDNITIVKQEEQWEIYYKPLAVERIEKWFKENKEEIYFEVVYQQGKRKGQIKERGYKIANTNFLIK